MVTHKFEQELDAALTCDSLVHCGSEKVHSKEQKLPIPPKIAARTIINMKLS